MVLDIDPFYSTPPPPPVIDINTTVLWQLENKNNTGAIFQYCFGFICSIIYLYFLSVGQLQMTSSLLTGRLTKEENLSDQ